MMLLVDQNYLRAKELSKEKIEISREKIDSAAKEVREDFKKLEQVSSVNSPSGGNC